MQIDFHHGVTYLCARLAGFPHEDAQKIAYAAQYIDDATEASLIKFENGALFSYISSAHKMLDYRNFKELANHRVWMPFHFLPGNGGLPTGKEPSDQFIDKVICRPNSPIAQDMVRECIQQRTKPYGLHRLGITMHVFADTWAHQGFAGVNHRVNEARNLVNAEGQPDQELRDRVANYFISEALPLGHGAVLSHPDKPFLRWGYTNGRGEVIVRDNPKDFLEAADQMCKVMQRYRQGNPDARVPGLIEKDKATIAALIESIIDQNKEVRHQKWLGAIAEGKFSFGREQVTYIPVGKGSWKQLSLGDEKRGDRGNEMYPYHPSFLQSDWKYFHDALQAHYFYIIHDLLPQYNICIA